MPLLDPILFLTILHDKYCPGIYFTFLNIPQVMSKPIDLKSCNVIGAVL
jgi:hypothetical protein